MDSLLRDHRNLAILQVASGVARQDLFRCTCQEHAGVPRFALTQDRDCLLLIPRRLVQLAGFQEEFQAFVVLSARQAVSFLLRVPQPLVQDAQAGESAFRGQSSGGKAEERGKNEFQRSWLSSFQLLRGDSGADRTKITFPSDPSRL